MQLHHAVDLPSEPARPFATRAMLILWPAFLMAGVLEMLVFVVVDPDSLHWFGVDALHWTRNAVYSVTFFIFWSVISTSAALTQLLMAFDRHRRTDKLIDHSSRVI